MSTIKINAITVPADSGDELARRFAARAGAVDGQDGFEGFELLKPTDGRNVWLVVTRWRDEAAFEAWTTSPAFAHGHRPAEGAEAQGGHPGGAPGGHPGGAPGGHPGGAPGGPASSEGDAAQRPVSTSAELWSYEVAGGSGGAA